MFITSFVNLSTDYDSYDARNQVDMIFLDFRKTFDSVPYKEFYSNSGKMSITGDLWLWLKNY